MTKKFFTILSLFLFLLFVPGLFFGEELTILHTNDTHSHLYPFGPNDSYGGIDRMSALIKMLKNKNGNVLTLNSGDVFVGTFAFNKYLGYPELKIMEGLYDAMCLGNHEFDLGIDALTGILSGAIPGEKQGYVTLPILCANINLPEGHPLKSIVKPSMVLNVRGLNVGLLGVVETTEYDYSPDVLPLLTDPYKAAGIEAYKLKVEQGCNIVICLSHLGKMADVMGLSQVPGIDIIVGGHSHDALFKPIITEDGKIIVQAGEFGMYLGELKVKVENGTVTLESYKLHPINRMVRKDPTLLRTLLALKFGILTDRRFGPVYEKTVAIALRNLEERWEEGNPYRDTALGNLVTDAIREGVKSKRCYADIALEANGYIATRIYRGKVVGNDILRAVPYGYDPQSGLGFKIEVIQLTGAQILAGLEFSVSYVEYFDDLAMQASGLTFEYDSSPSQPAGSRVDPASVKVRGVPIHVDRLYWVALNEQLVLFLSSIGMVPIKEVKTGLFEYNLVRDYAQKLRLLAYRSEGRIIDTAVKKK